MEWSGVSAAFLHFLHIFGESARFGCRSNATRTRFFPAVDTVSQVGGEPRMNSIHPNVGHRCAWPNLWKLWHAQSEWIANDWI